MNEIVELIKSPPDFPIPNNPNHPAGSENNQKQASLNLDLSFRLVFKNRVLNLRSLSVQHCDVW